jgi:hypothetical protein
LILGRCPPSGLCTARVRLVAARMLARVKSPLLDELRPLPAATLSTNFFEDVALLQAMLGERGSLSPLATPLDEKDRDLVLWLVKHREWKHVSLLNLYKIGALPWPQLEAEIRRAIDAGGDDQESALKLLMKTRWTPRIPNDFITKAREIARSRKIDAFPVGLFQEVSGIVNCSLSDNLSNNERYKQLKQVEEGGRSCKELAGLEPDPTAAMQALSKTRSMNDYLKQFNDLGVQYWPEQARRQMQTHLIATLGDAICAYSSDHPSFDANEELDRKQLYVALRSLRPAAIWQDLLPWYIRDKKRTCSDRIIGPGIRTTLARNDDVATFELIDWIAPERKQDAVPLMQILAGTFYGPVPDLYIARSGTGVPDQDYIRWFEKHGDYLDVLFLTSGSPDEFRLVRRTAALKLASCKCTSCDSSRLLRLASEGGELARTYATPATAKPALMAEAEFHAMQLDWRRAMAVCEHCDPVERLSIGTALIGHLAREVAGRAPHPPSCFPVNKERFELLFKNE